MKRGASKCAMSAPFGNVAVMRTSMSYASAACFSSSLGSVPSSTTSNVAKCCSPLDFVVDDDDDDDDDDHDDDDTDDDECRNLPSTLRFFTTINLF